MLQLGLVKLVGSTQLESAGSQLATVVSTFSRPLNKQVFRPAMYALQATLILTLTVYTNSNPTDPIEPDSQPFRSRANSLPGANRPIEPWPIRSLELSLPGLFTPWPSRSLEPSLPGPFTPWPSRYSINRIIFAALAYSLYRPMTWR